MEQYDSIMYIQNATEKILLYMGFQPTVTAEREEDTIKVRVKTDEDSLVIGKNGLTLDALQYLLNVISAKQLQERVFIVLDIDNYRQKKDEQLEQLAIKKAMEAVKTGNTVKLTHLSPRERRIIHMTIANIEGVTSRSEGEDREDKTVLIIPEGKKE